MKFARMRCWLVFLTCAAIPACTPSVPPPRREPAIKLIVFIVFDQMRGDYLTRWENQFDSGFHQVCRQGTWFTNCHYPYASTSTGPGHASLATGCSPGQHGIIGNDWYERALGR